MAYLISDIIKFLSNVSIGIGLSFSSMAALALLRLLEIYFESNTSLIAYMGIVLFVLGCGCFYMYKKIFKFDSFPALELCSVILSTILTFALMSTAQITGFLSLLLATFCFLTVAIVGIYRNNRVFKICSIVFFSIISFFVLQIFVLHMLPSFFPYLLTASGFLAVGIVGISRDINCRKLGFCFMVLSLLFLVCVPIVNVWQIRGGYGGEGWSFFYRPIYNVFTIPLILVSVVFFVLGSMLILYKRSQTIRRQDLVDATVTEQENFKHDSACSTLGETNGAKKVNITCKSVGFSFMVLSQLSFVWAAIVYTQPGLRSWEFGMYPLNALPFVAIGVALFALGFGLMLYKESTRLGFFLVASGSVVLIIAGFAYVYETEFKELVFGYVPLIHHINPYRDFTLPLIFLSLVPLVLGYALMLNKSLKKNTLRLLRR